MKLKFVICMALSEMEIQIKGRKCCPLCTNDINATKEAYSFLLVSDKILNKKFNKNLPRAEAILSSQSLDKIIA